jgi:hypothetical protein
MPSPGQPGPQPFGAPGQPGPQPFGAPGQQPFGAPAQQPFGAPRAGFGPGGFGAPQPFPGGPPMGDPRYAQMQAQKAQEPSLGGALGKLGCGGFFALSFVFPLVIFGFHGYGASFGIGLLVGLCFGGVVAGIANLAKKKIGVAGYFGTAFAVALLATFIGPPISDNYQKGEEKEKYDKLVKQMDGEYFSADSWKYQYESEVDQKFQRPEWKGQWMIARVNQAKRENKPTDLRNVMKEIDDAKDVDGKVEELYDEAREDASEAFKEYYDKAKAKMYEQVTGERAFPVDPQLRNAFATILEDLTKSSDGNVYVSFVNAVNLAKPEGNDEMLKQMQALPQVRARFPTGNAPVIPEGDAFSPAYDEARRDVFMTATRESFQQVFDNADLFTLVPLAKGDTKDKRIVFEVSSKIIRINDFFSYDKEGVLAGFLFAIEVEWGFKIYDRSGKVLYAPEVQKSQAAQNVRVRSGEGDPDWAMYSVMMDSAYYNYAREMTGKFGLTPPPEKQFFTYTKPMAGEKGKSLR